MPPPLPSGSFLLQKMIHLPNIRKYLPLAILVAVGVIAIVLFTLGVKKLFKGSTATDTRIVIAGAKATQNVNKEFDFPIMDAEGQEATKLKFKVDTVDKRDEIVVDGKRATSVKGRTFLVISLKITNTYTASIQVSVADYLRLSLNGKESELLAPDIHNDPVLIQAGSTKLTRVAFPINDTDKDMNLWVGEIKGKKEKIKLTLN